MSDVKNSPSGARVIMVVFLPFGCGYYLSYLFRTINAVISENLIADLNLGPAALGLLTSIYLIAFASTQFPLGVALDRYGPRWVNAVLLMFAAAGAAIFAFAESFWLLLVGRALIGIGVSAALMSAFKANALWFPGDRIPLMNNLIGAFGAVGAITATRPVEMLLHIAEWRDIFAGLAVVTVLVSISVLLLVPEKKITTSSQETFASQMAGYKNIFREPFFWRVTLMYAFGYTALVSYQTLWADPWLRDVAGLGQTARANCLLSIQIGFLIGLLLTGFFADVLRRTRVQALHVFSGGVLLFIGVQVVLACGVTEGVTVIWGLFGFLSSSVFLAYAANTVHFPSAITGRVITAMNFFPFVLAFLAQWGIGGVIEAFARKPDGGYSIEAHSTALWIIIVMQVICYLYLIKPVPRKKTL